MNSEAAEDRISGDWPRAKVWPWTASLFMNDSMSTWSVISRPIHALHEASVPNRSRKAYVACSTPVLAVEDDARPQASMKTPRD